MKKFNEWYANGGKNACVQCQTEVARFYCMEVFPPCKSETHYAVYPCKEECRHLKQTCNIYSPFDCPLDGPELNATVSGKGSHVNSNNELQSCFTSNGTIIPYPFKPTHLFF